LFESIYISREVAFSVLSDMFEERLCEVITIEFKGFIFLPRPKSAKEYNDVIYFLLRIIGIPHQESLFNLQACRITRLHANNAGRILIMATIRKFEPKQLHTGMVEAESEPLSDGVALGDIINVQVDWLCFSRLVQAFLFFFQQLGVSFQRLGRALK